jgi:hypothetical protein
MNLKNKQPVLVPFCFRDEIEKLSKAALMDMAWDFAFQMSDEAPDAAMSEFRRRREIVLTHREQARNRL